MQFGIIEVVDTLRRQQFSMDLSLIFSLLACFAALTSAFIFSVRSRDPSVSVIAVAIVLSALIPLLVIPEFNYSNNHHLSATILFLQSSLMLIALAALWRIKRSWVRAETERRQTELQFQTLVENMPDGFRINKDGVTVYANRRFCEMLGYEQNEILGKSADLIFFNDERFQKILEQRKLRAKGQSGSYEMHLKKKDGASLPAILSVQPIFNPDGEFVASCGVFTDISAREETERNLRKSEEKFRAYARAASDVFWELDAELKFVVDAEAGHPESSPFSNVVDGTSWLSVLNAEAVAELERHIGDLEAKRPFRGLRLVLSDRRSKKRVWRVSGRPSFTEDDEFVGYRGTATEITAEIDATEEAAQAQAVLLSALNSMSDALAVFDENDRLLIFNRRCTEIYTELKTVLRPGISFEEIVRSGVEHSVYDHGLASDEEYVSLRLKRHRNPEGRFVQRLRGNRWVQITERRIKNGGTVAVWTDVTELKRKEQELIQAQKMEAVGQLTGGIAHDFNNLLAVVLGNLELLQSQLEDGSSSEKYARRAVTGARRGVALTQRLLSFSRKQRLQPTSVDVKQLICGMTDLIQGSLGETIRIETEFAQELPHALIDSHQLETALLNLALNGRDAMHSKGTLRIVCFASASPSAVSAQSATPVVQHLVSSEMRFVRIDVIDSGDGIDPEAQAQVFEPFYTTKEVGRGSGLGLSMVYGFVKQSGGHIRLQSVVGEGTCVSVYLPIAERKVIEVERSKVISEMPIGSGERILVVEDDEGVRELTRVMLEDLGYVVFCAENAAGAMKVFEGNETCDLLLTDVVLSGGESGPELAKILTALRPGLPVLFFSGYSQHPVVGDLPVEIPLLQKPFRKIDLARIVRQVLITSSKLDAPLDAVPHLFTQKAPATKVS